MHFNTFSPLMKQCTTKRLAEMLANETCEALEPSISWFDIIGKLSDTWFSAASPVLLKVFQTSKQKDLQKVI